ncbi:hypothetical protein [Methanoregula sp.]
MLYRTSSPPLMVKIHRLISQRSGRHDYTMSIPTRRVRRELRPGAKGAGP